MGATALTKVTAAAYGHGIADANFQAVDQGNGNTFVNTGNTVLLVKSASGSVNPTFTSVAASRFTNGQTETKVPATPVTVGHVGLYGPFLTGIYGNTVTVSWDTDSGVTAAVVELTETPL